MSERYGWFAARIERAHYDAGMFAGWRLRAWTELNCDADFETGVVRMTSREMVLAWEVEGATAGSLERWLAELAVARYIRIERLGESARAGRRIIIEDVEARARQREDTPADSWSNPGSKAGAIGGAINPSNGATPSPTRGAIGGAKLEQSLEHVVRKETKEVTKTPSVPTEPVPGADAAQRVVVAFDDALKAAGRDGVPSTAWAAQRKMAGTALRNGMPEDEAIEAIRWGMEVEWERKRLRAYGMKVVREVWVAWQERGRSPPAARRRANAYADPAQQQDQFKYDSPWRDAEVA